METSIAKGMGNLMKTKDPGFTHIPSKTFELHRLERKILTRSAFVLFKELGIQSGEDYIKYFGFLSRKQEKTTEKVEETEETIIVSPMKRDEFQRILKDGWGLGNEIVSPIKDEDFQDFLRGTNIESTMKKPKTSLAGNLVQRESIPSDESFLKPVMPRRSAPSAPRQLFPIASSTPRRASTPLKSNSTKETPNLKILPKMELTPQIGEGPLENRASRLRKMKMDERRKSCGKEAFENLDLSFQ